MDDEGRSGSDGPEQRERGEGGRDHSDPSRPAVPGEGRPAVRRIAAGDGSGGKRDRSADDTDRVPTADIETDVSAGYEGAAPSPEEVDVEDLAPGAAPGDASTNLVPPEIDGELELEIDPPEPGEPLPEPDPAETIDDAETVRAAVLDDVVDHFASAEPESDFVPYPDESFVRERLFDFSYLEGYREVERQWVTRPYAYVTILFDEENKEYVYRVVEPTLDEFERYVRSDLVDYLRNSLMYEDVPEEVSRSDVFERRGKPLIREHAATVDDGTLHKLLYYLRRDFTRFGPIDPIMRDPDIEDISCDRIDVPVFVYHRAYRDLETNVSFSRSRLNAFTVRLAQRAGKQLSVSSPLLDASLPDGSRLQLTLGGDVATRGSNFTIRKFSDVPYTPVDLVNWNTFSLDQMVYFWLAIENNKSLIFAGGTGSGKTTSMNAVSFFIPPRSKVVSIEDTREIELPHRNWVQSVTRQSVSAEGRGEVSMYNLLQAALRQRPEYLLVGEIRTEQRVALTFFQAMGTGHTAYTTVHADSVETALNRLMNPPLSVPTAMIQDLDVISIQGQTFIGEDRVRRNQLVAEVLPTGEDPDAVPTEEVFSWDPATDTHEWVGDSYLLEEIREQRGWSEDRLQEEFDNRRRVLQHLLDEGITDYRSVSEVLHTYSNDPGFVLGRIENGGVGDDPIAEMSEAPDR